MAETDTEIIPNGTGTLSDEDERMKQRPADIDADVREMERRKRVEALMSSKLFREELERVLDQQMHEGADAPLLQRIKEMVGGRLHTGNFRGPSCVLPINDIRGIEGVGYEKGEKILRCKLAALYRLVDLFGWTQCGVASQLTARLNTAVEQLLISPRGLMPHEVTASSLLKVDMQGTVIDTGTTNYGVHKSGFSVHAAVHAARPDVRCVLHLRSPPVLAISATKQGLLPLCTEAALIGDVAYHRVPTGILDNEERDKIVRVLGPSCKILFLRSQGALCCGSTLEEAFYHAKHLHTAADVQLKLATVPRDQLAVMDDEERKEVYDAARAEGAAESNKWRAGGEEFEALMRMLDNAGFRTGYIYRNPLVKNDVPRPKNDVEVPPAVSSLGYLLEEEEMYRQGIWKKGQGKTGERTRWLNSPNVYQKVEVLETGTNDPKKITKWVDANNEEWVQDGSPGHSSTPMKIDAALQFVPKNTNPKEFKALQQQIKDNRRADKISAGPQSHILEGVTWDEANRLNEGDASATHAGDHVVLVGAASKGIIQRGYQHNATVYSAPYARNPFEQVSERDLDEYTRRVTGHNYYDTDLSESEAISAAQMTSPVSETEEESRDEHRVLRIETKQAPMRSQPEVVLSDDATDFLNAERSHVDRTRGVGHNPKLTRSPNPSAANKKHEYPRCPNFQSIILKYESPKNDPKCKINLKKRYDSEPTNAYAVEMCNPGYLSSRGSLNSVPSIEWDVKKADNNFRSQSLPRKLGRKEQQQRYYRSCSHAGFINTFIKNPEPVHYHMPKCRKCGSFNSSYDWEITKRDLKSLGQSSIWHSYENIHKGCLRDGDKKVLAICDVVRVKEMDAPVFNVNEEFIDSEEYNEDCYLENTYLSNSTVVENSSLDRTLVVNEAVVVEANIKSNILLVSSDKAGNIITDTDTKLEKIDSTGLDIASRDNTPTIEKEDTKDIKSVEVVDENGVYRAECVYIETSGESSKSDSRKSSSNSPESNQINADVDVLITQQVNENFEASNVQELVLGIEAIAVNKEVKSPIGNERVNVILEADKFVVTENETLSYVDSSVYRVFGAVLRELKSKLHFTVIDELPETQIDFTVDNEEGEYLNFTNELDFDRAVYDSPVKNLITKDIREFLVPLDFYADVKESPSKFNKSAGKVLETIAEETKVSDSSNDSVKDSSGDKDTDQNSIDNKIVSEILNINDDLNINSKAINELSDSKDNETSSEECLNKVGGENREENIELPVPNNSVTDLSCLEVCENFKISIESSSQEIPSFDSTAEFEKIEAIADVLGVLIKRVSITIVNKEENDFYNTVDKALKIKHKGITFFGLAVSDAIGSREGQEVSNYQEPKTMKSEENSNESDVVKDDQNKQAVSLLNKDEIECNEEVFSILEIVKNIEQEIIGQNLTVLSEDSDLDPKTHPYKVCESIVYHILCTVYYEVKQKFKGGNGNGKAVVTVVDVEDILFTALPIWDIVLIPEKVANSDDTNEELNPTVEPVTSTQDVVFDAEIPCQVSVSSNDNHTKGKTVSEIESTDILIDDAIHADLEPISQRDVIVSDVNISNDSQCVQEDLVFEQCEGEILTETELSETKKDNVLQDATIQDDSMQDVHDKKHEGLIFSENDEVVIKDEDTTYCLVTDICSNVVDGAKNEDDCKVVQEAQKKVCWETSSQASDIASSLNLDINLNSFKPHSNMETKEEFSWKEDKLQIETTLDSESGFKNNIQTAISQNYDVPGIVSEHIEKQTKLETDVVIVCEVIGDLTESLLESVDKQIGNLGILVDDGADFAGVKSIQEPTSPNSHSVPEDSEQENDLQERKIAVKEERNSIASKITDLTDEKDYHNASASYSQTVSVGNLEGDAIKESQLMAANEINRIVSNFTDLTDDKDNASTSSSETIIVGNEDEDGAIKESEVIALDEINRIVSKTTDITDENDNASSSSSEAITVGYEHEECPIRESQFIASEEINRIVSKATDLTDKTNKNNAFTSKSQTVPVGKKDEVAIKESKVIAVEDVKRIVSEITDDNYTDSASGCESQAVPSVDEDAIKESQLIAIEEINRIVPEITDLTNYIKTVSVGYEHEETIIEHKVIDVEETTLIISNIPHSNNECDQDSVVTVGSDLPINDPVMNSKCLDLPFSVLNPNAVPFFMKNCQSQEIANEENHENDMDTNISISETVQQDVIDILDDVLEVVSSMYERYVSDNTYSLSPEDSNESIEGIDVEEQNLDKNIDYLLEKEEIGVIEDKEDNEPFKIITIDVSKCLEESRKIHTQNREETNVGSPGNDDCIVLDVYDTKSYGKDEENKYVTELNSAIKGYPSENDDYNDSLNESNEDLYIEKPGTPKFVELVSRDEDGSIDSVTYNSHILQTIVENLLQDVISEFVLDDSVTEVTQDANSLTEAATKVVESAFETFSFDSKKQRVGATSDTDGHINQNETFVLDRKDKTNFKKRTASVDSPNEISFDDMAYESCSKTDLDQTYVLGELATNNSEFTEDISYFDTAFCEDTMLTNQSSPYKNNSPTFTSCDESPIKTSNTAYLDDSMLYDKCDEISPFERTAAVLSMSQCVNAGGVKYWLSFDGSFAEIEDKNKSNRGRKSRDIPTFYSFDTVDDLPVRGGSNSHSNVFKHKTSDSSIYMTASCSKSKNDAWTSYSHQPSTSKANEQERRLIFDCSKRSKKRVRRREYNTWPPYDESLFYRLISNFRLSESFDCSDLDNRDGKNVV